MTHKFQSWDSVALETMGVISRKVVTGEKAMVAQVFLKKGAEALETQVRAAGGPEGLYVNLAIQVEACAAVIADPRT
jgi:succinate-semialdehyde dehydrogenase/glutarate-semialdehyde dehydrogenase/succinate-semialdehyde dehydrogenase